MTSLNSSQDFVPSSPLEFADLFALNISICAENDNPMTFEEMRDSKLNDATKPDSDALQDHLVPKNQPHDTNEQFCGYIPPIEDGSDDFCGSIDQQARLSDYMPHNIENYTFPINNFNNENAKQQYICSNPISTQIIDLDFENSIWPQLSNKIFKSDKDDYNLNQDSRYVICDSLESELKHIYLKQKEMLKKKVFVLSKKLSSALKQLFDCQNTSHNEIQIIWETFVARIMKIKSNFEERFQKLNILIKKQAILDSSAETLPTLQWINLYVLFPTEVYRESSIEGQNTKQIYPFF